MSFKKELEAYRDTVDRLKTVSKSEGNRRPLRRLFNSATWEIIGAMMYREERRSSSPEEIIKQNHLGINASHLSEGPIEKKFSHFLSP